VKVDSPFGRERQRHPSHRTEAGEVDGMVVARYPYRSEGTGRCDYATKGEEGLHAFSFVFSTAALATGVSGTAGTPFASAA
jgi:hypothetical protein